MKRVAVVVVAALAAVLAVPVAAHASDDNVYIWVNRIEADGAKTAAMTGSVALQSGDCSMNVPSFVSVSPPALDGSSLVKWEGIGYTRHTHSADHWQLFLNFYDAYGNFVKSAPKMVGAGMSVWYQTYVWDRYTTVPMSQAEFDGLSLVQWIGVC